MRGRISLLAMALLVLTDTSLSVFFYEQSHGLTYDQGAVVRGDVGQRKIALVFTGHEFADGGEFIRRVLREKKAKASFFFTGDFFRQAANAGLISGLLAEGRGAAWSDTRRKRSGCLMRIRRDDNLRKIYYLIVCL